MPHIDDGTLHAWLDGAVPALAEAGALPDGLDEASIAAHLRACADCRARLEAERLVREQAGLVLEDARVAVPAAPMPALAPTRPRRAWIPLAWAASLALALGAGWWASTLQQANAPVAVAESDELESAAAPAAAAASAAPARPGVAPDQAAEPVLAAAGDEARAEAGVPAALPPASFEAAAAAPGFAAATGQARDSPAGLPANEATAAARTAEPAGLPRFVVPAAPPPPVALNERAAPLAAGQARAVPTAPTTPTAPAAPAAPAAREVEAAALADVPVVSDTRDVDAAVNQTRAMVSQGYVTAWVPLPAREDEVHAQAFMVEGAGPPVVEMARIIGGTLVRVRQRLESDELVELYTWRAQPLALEQVVVTGEPAQRRERAVRREGAAEAGQATAQQRQRAAAAHPAEVRELNEKTAADAAPTRVATIRLTDAVLPNGERELAVRVAATGTVILLRGDLSLETLHRLADRLVTAR